MKKLICVAVCLASLTSVNALAAPVVSFAGGSGTTANGTTVFQNFEGYAPGAAIGTNAFALNTSGGNGARPAFGSTGNYGSVLSGGSFQTNFGPTSVFSFVVGSLDTYNTLTLTFADNTTQKYEGGQIINAPNYPSGDQTSAQSNGVVTYSVGSGPKITGALFESGGNSFEVDNLAAGVPEPATWALMIMGFGMVGASMRRRTAKLTYAI